MIDTPSGWMTVSVEDCVSERRAGYWGASNPTPERSNLVKVIRNGDITAGTITSWADRYFSDAEVASSAVGTGDVLITTSGHIGKSVMGRDGYCASNFVRILRPDPRLIDGQFLRYALMTRAASAAMRRWSGGSTIQNLRSGFFGEPVVNLPPLAEQRRIVAAIEEHLSRLDAADEVLAASLKRADAIEPSLIDAPLEGPWDLQPLGRLLREPLRNGHSAKGTANGGVRTLTLTAVTRRDFSEANTKLTSADPSRVAGLWLEPGDVLIERSNTPELVGTAALYEGPREWAIFPDLLIRVRVGDEISPAFLELVLRARRARRYFQGAAKGIAGSMPKIDQGTIEQFEVPVPPMDEQRRLVAEVEQHLSAVEAVRMAIKGAQRRSTSLRRAVLERAFRGELVPHDLTDEPASVLLERIRAGRAAAPKQSRRSRVNA